jgi:hypothetical protein
MEETREKEKGRMYEFMSNLENTPLFAASD